MLHLSLAACILIASFTPALVYTVVLLRLQADVRAREKAGARPDWNRP
ncbi:MAG: hypothetical protein HQK81_02520 [Desulfovibrionaceae bacterium]|nr:hypothetical protein [Desulfovibrionaceae bacterium]MBF0512919.1 hypothetical protein [Desulfovibrionaceae bacterium]